MGQAAHTGDMRKDHMTVLDLLGMIIRNGS